jgi:pimeloyl-ACP methyl ester carboxylesterase
VRPTLIVVRWPLILDAQQSVRAVSEAIAGAKVLVMLAESMMINMEQPEAFNRVVLNFLDAINQSLKQ